MKNKLINSIDCSYFEGFSKHNVKVFIILFYRQKNEFYMIFKSNSFRIYIYNGIVFYVELHIKEIHKKRVVQINV